MENTISFDAVEQWTLLNSKPWAIIRWLNGTLQMGDLFSILMNEINEQQVCSDNQAYTPNNYQLPFTMPDQSLACRLSINNIAQLQLHAETDQESKATGLVCATSLALNSSKNETSDILRYSDAEGCPVNNPLIEESVDEVSVDPFDNQIPEVKVLHEIKDAFSTAVVQENYQPQVTQSVFDSSLSNTGLFSTISGQYCCRFCAYESDRKYNVILHMFTHFKDRPKDGICPVCLKEYYRSGCMNRHYEVVHLKRRFVCECEKSYTRKYALANHQGSGKCHYRQR